MDLPVNRRLTDAEIAIGVAEAILDSRLNAGMDLPFQPGEFLARLGQQNPPAGFGESNPRADWEFRVAEHCWRLVGLGYLVPTVGSGWGAFHITQRGKQFLATFDPASITAGGLDARLEAVGFERDELPRQYVRLAQDCFLAGHWEASVVMLGAATEALIDQVADALAAFNKVLGLASVSRPARPTARQNLGWLTDFLTAQRRALVKMLDTKGTDSGWIEPMRDVLAGAGQAIRLTRNEAGHPTGISINQDDALPLMAIFPRLADLSLRALEALNART